MMSYQIDNITLGYGELKILLRDFSLSIVPGELTALIGRNGIGKSTLLRSLAGLVCPLSGDVKIDGKSVFAFKSREVAENIAFVTTENIKVPHLSVWDVVSMGRSPYTNWVGSLSDMDCRVVRQAIVDVGVEHLTHANIDRLSDGERQRVMVARAIAQQTPIILLDEPSAFLDLPNRYQIVMLLSQIAHQSNKTIIFSTHDLSTAIKLCDKIWVMSADGLECGTPAELAASGAYNTIFHNTPLTFDGLTGEIKIER